MTAPIARVTRSMMSGPDTPAAIWFLGALPQPRVSGGADRRGLRPGRPPRPARQRQPGPRPQPDNETFFVLDGELRVFSGKEEHTKSQPHVRGAAQVCQSRLCRHLRHRAVPHPCTPRPGSSSSPPRSASPPGPSPCRRLPDHRTSPRWRRPPPETNHDLDSAAPSLRTAQVGGVDSRRAAVPRLGRLKLRGQPDERGLVAEPAEEVPPTGRPSSFHHSGTDIAGLPVRLATMPA